MEMRRKLVGFISFAATIAVLVGVLKILNWLPTTVEEGLVRRYESVEEVKARLNVKNVYVPSYFPQRFAWPPSEILAQSKPFFAIVMEFEDVESGDVALVISQSASQGFRWDRKIRIVQVRERVNYQLKGRDALLEVGVCEKDLTCSRISWEEGMYRLEIVMKSGPFELLKIANSMIQ